MNRRSNGIPCKVVMFVKNALRAWYLHQIHQIVINIIQSHRTWMKTPLSLAFGNSGFPFGGSFESVMRKANASIRCQKTLVVSKRCTKSSMCWRNATDVVTLAISWSIVSTADAERVEAQASTKPQGGGRMAMAN